MYYSSQSLDCQTFEAECGNLGLSTYLRYNERIARAGRAAESTLSKKLMYFDFLPLRFELTARDPLYFPPGKAANVLRGALGSVLRGLVCIEGCPGAKVCELRERCPYAMAFEPRADSSGNSPAPSGFGDLPRPFVFRARALDGRTLATGESFHFDVHIFSLDRGIVAGFLRAFAALASEGLGSNRGRAELITVRTIPAGGAPARVIFEHARGAFEDAHEALPPDLVPASIGLAIALSPSNRIAVDFLAPTELKHRQEIAGRPEFPILFARIRDRIATLRRLYGPGPLEVDFREIGERAATVRMTRCDIRHVPVERRSTRTGQVHPIGGFVGTAEYEGELGEFLPWLEAACWTGVGRQAVWGKGEIAIRTI